jgi:hypothetical protein
VTVFQRARTSFVVVGLSLAAIIGVSIVAIPWGSDELEIVDVEPAEWSTDQTSHPEPAIAVSPGDPKTIAIIALRMGYSPTVEQGFCGSEWGGMVISLDGGATWSKRCVFPKAPTKILGDASVDFTGDGQALVVSYLSPPGWPQVKTVLGWTDASTTNAQDVPLTSHEWSDMPFTVAASRSGTKTYSVGVYQELPLDVCPGAGLVYWWNAKGAKGRPCVSMRDGYVLTVRTAHANDGTFYGLFFNVRPGDTLSDLVLVRDRLNDALTDAPTFAGFTDDVPLDPAIASGDPCATPDGRMGQRLKNCTPVPEDFSPCSGLGNQVRNPNQIALAIDPNDSHTVYFVYGDMPPGQPFTLHLAKFSDATGSRQVTELLSIPDALNPALAITFSGRVAFAYQQHVGNTWQTFLRMSKRSLWNTYALTDATPDTEPGIGCASTSPYLGDYVDMVAVGEDIYGTFSFDNNPAKNPNAVYLRDKTVLGGTIPYSIDPFFYHLKSPQPLYRTLIAHAKIWTVKALQRLMTMLGARLPNTGVPPDTLPPIPPRGSG